MTEWKTSDFTKCGEPAFKKYIHVPGKWDLKSTVYPQTLFKEYKLVFLEVNMAASIQMLKVHTLQPSLSTEYLP